MLLLGASLMLEWAVPASEGRRMANISEEGVPAVMGPQKNPGLSKDRGFDATFEVVLNQGPASQGKYRP
jgi:hypothetical protein